MTWRTGGGDGLRAPPELWAESTEAAMEEDEEDGAAPRATCGRAESRRGAALRRWRRQGTSRPTATPAPPAPSAPSATLCYPLPPSPQMHQIVDEACRHLRLALEQQPDATALRLPRPADGLSGQAGIRRQAARGRRTTSHPPSPGPSYAPDTQRHQPGEVVRAARRLPRCSSSTPPRHAAPPSYTGSPHRRRRRRRRRRRPRPRPRPPPPPPPAPAVAARRKTLPLARVLLLAAEHVEVRRADPLCALADTLTALADLPPSGGGGGAPPRCGGPVCAVGGSGPSPRRGSARHW